jgi:hypothetical protein
MSRNGRPLSPTPTPAPARVLFLDQMELVGSDLRRTQHIRRFLDISRQLSDLIKIQSLRVWRFFRPLLCGKREAAQRFSHPSTIEPSEKKAASGSSSPDPHHRDRQRRITAERSSPMSFIQ